MVDFCKKAEDRGASSFMHKPPTLFQESLLVTSPLFQVICLTMSLKLDAIGSIYHKCRCILKPKMVKEFLYFQLWKFAWYVSSMKYGLMSFKKMMEELLVPLTLF